MKNENMVGTLTVTVALVLLVVGCRTVKDNGELSRWGQLVAKVYPLIAGKDKPADPAKPPVEPTQPSEPEKVNKGGAGLYKPEGNLWLLPSKNPTNGKAFRAEHLARAGEFRDEAGTELVKWFRWPDKIGPLSNRPINGAVVVGTSGAGEHPGMYHADKVKCRGAKATADGTWFLAWDTVGQLLFRKQIQERDVRQE